MVSAGGQNQLQVCSHLPPPVHVYFLHISYICYGCTLWYRCSLQIDVTNYLSYITRSKFVQKLMTQKVDAATVPPPLHLTDAHEDPLCRRGKYAKYGS